MAKLNGMDCVKRVRIRSYSGPHFSRIFPYSDWIQSISPYSVRIRENAGKMWTRITPTMGTFYAAIKKPLRKWHTFWMASCLICYFIVILFYIKRMWLLLRNLTTVSLLKSKFSGKFQRFNAIDGNIEMLKNS